MLPPQVSVETSDIARLFGALSAALVAFGSASDANAQESPRVQDTLKEPPPDPPTDDPMAPKPAIAKPATPEPAKDAGAAEAPKVETASALPSWLKRIDVTGYVLPTGSLAVQDQAVPRDKFVYGIVSSRFGVAVTAHPFDKWTAVGHVGFDASWVRSGVGAATQVGDSSSKVITTVPVEEATVSYAPVNVLSLKLGHQRLPFSLAQSVVITGQMFPNRAGPSAVFNTGADDGLRVDVKVLENRLSGAAGVYNGGSLGLTVPGTTSVGPTFAVFLATQPLGEMPAHEADMARGPFRFALGFGGLMRAGQVYDATGYGSTGFQDLRASAALRASFRGLFLQGEYLRRQQSDDLSLRPSHATGAYGQLSYFIPAGNVAFAPIARVGRSTVGDDTSERGATDVEGGLSFFPEARVEDPSTLRITAHYAYEHRDPFRETSHGAVFNVQVRW